MPIQPRQIRNTHGFFFPFFGLSKRLFITLRNIIIEVVTLGGSLDLGDIFSLRTTIPSKMEAKEIDVTALSLKRPRIIVSWKDPIRKALGKIEVEIDNPKRREMNKKPKTPKP